MAEIRDRAKPMSVGTALVISLAQAVCIGAAWLVRSGARSGQRDAHSHAVRPEVVRNASIVRILPLAVAGPLLAFGASGDAWPVLVGASCVGLGAWLCCRLRGRIDGLAAETQQQEAPETFHAFVAQQHGDDRRVRLIAAMLSLVALLGALGVELLAVAAITKPVVPMLARAAPMLLVAMLVVGALPAWLAGHSGVLQSTQQQLGFLYLGWSGAIALLLYVHVSALGAVPPHGALTILLAGVWAVVILVRRRSRYVDTALDSVAASGGRPPVVAQLLSRFGKTLNGIISIVVVALVVIVVMELLAVGTVALIGNAGKAMRAATSVPTIALVALALVPLLHPLVDVVSWQASGAMRRPVDDRRRRAPFASWASESAFAWLLAAMLGGAVALVLAIDPGGDVVASMLARLASADDGVSSAVLVLLLLGMYALAVSTVGALVSASTCTIRDDVVPALHAGFRGRLRDKGASRAATIASTVLALLVVMAAGVVDAVGSVRFGSGGFLAMLFAFLSVPLALAPLVIADACERRDADRLPASWALAVIAAGPAGAAGAVAVHFATGSQAWLWAVAPVCVGSSTLVYAVARVAVARRCARKGR